MAENSRTKEPNINDEIPDFPVSLFSSYLTTGETSLFLTPSNKYDIISGGDIERMQEKYDLIGVHALNLSDGTALLRAQFLWFLKDYCEYDKVC